MWAGERRGGGEWVGGLGRWEGGNDVVVVVVEENSGRRGGGWVGRVVLVRVVGREGAGCVDGGQVATECQSAGLRRQRERARSSECSRDCR